jgi:hypothetical protein
MNTTNNGINSNGLDNALMIELEQLRAENARLKAAKTSRVALKVTDKGGVSVYGLGRFPVTLYRSQWDTLLNMRESLVNFMKENEHVIAPLEAAHNAAKTAAKTA